MATICNIEDYRINNKKHSAPATGTPNCSLRELIGPVQTWTSDTEKAQVLQTRAKRDRKAWRKKYP